MPHHTAKGFRNVAPEVALPPSQLDFLRWRWESLGRGEDSAPLEPAPVEHERLRAPDPGDLAVTWIGHATALMQLGGMNVLTDPLFSRRAIALSLRCGTLRKERAKPSRPSPGPLCCASR